MVHCRPRSVLFVPEETFYRLLDPRTKRAKTYADNVVIILVRFLKSKPMPFRIELNVTDMLHSHAVGILFEVIDSVQVGKKIYRNCLLTERTFGPSVTGKTSAAKKRYTALVKLKCVFLQRIRCFS